MSNLTVTCQTCARVVDLSDSGVSVVPTIDAGYAFCPWCGEIISLDADTTRRAGIARGDRPSPPPSGFS